MKGIWKFPITGTKQTVEMPKGAQILSVQMQRNIPCIWALCDTEPAYTDKRRFVVVPTGHGADTIFWSKLTHLGTCIEQDGSYVWHVFEEKPA